MNKVVLHPAFNNASTLDADFALLRLNITMAITDFVRPICLPKSNEDYAAVSKIIYYILYLVDSQVRESVLTVKMNWKIQTCFRVQSFYMIAPTFRLNVCLHPSALVKLATR